MILIDRVNVVAKQDVELVHMHVDNDVFNIIILWLILNTSGSIMEIIVDDEADACGMVEDNDIRPPVDISTLGKIEDDCTNTDNCCSGSIGISTITVKEN